MKTWDVIMVGAVAAGALLLAGQVLAQGADGVPGDRLVVPLPDVSTLSEAEARDLTRELAEANVVSDNCPDFEVTDGEWQLLNGTSDVLLAQLGLDPLAYDREFFRPAFAILDEPEACATHGPRIQPVLDRLVEMGGATAPDLPAPDEGATDMDGTMAETPDDATTAAGTSDGSPTTTD